MDLGATIVGLIIVVISIIPFVIISSVKKRKEKRLIQSLNNLALQENKNISLHEIWGQNIIGLDKDETAFYAIRKTKDNTTSYKVNLTEMQKCSLINKSKNIKYDDGNATITDKLALSFINKEKEKEEVIVNFYDSEYDNPIMSGVLQIVEKWNNF